MTPTFIMSGGVISGNIFEGAQGTGGGVGVSYRSYGSLFVMSGGARVVYNSEGTSTTSGDTMNAISLAGGGAYIAVGSITGEGSLGTPSLSSSHLLSRVLRSWNGAAVSNYVTGAPVDRFPHTAGEGNFIGENGVFYTQAFLDARAALIEALGGASYAAPGTGPADVALLQNVEMGADITVDNQLNLALGGNAYSLTVPAGKTLTVSATGGMSLGSGASLVVNGTVNSAKSTPITVTAATGTPAVISGTGAVKKTVTGSLFSHADAGLTLTDVTLVGLMSTTTNTTYTLTTATLQGALTTMSPWWWWEQAPFSR